MNHRDTRTYRCNFDCLTILSAKEKEETLKTPKNSSCQEFFLGELFHQDQRRKGGRGNINVKNFGAFSKLWFLLENTSYFSAH